MRRNNATAAHWTNILFPWQVFIKDKDGDKAHWSNILFPWQVVAKKQVGTVEPMQGEVEGINQQNQSQNNQIVYILIALAIGLCLAFLFVKRN